ncbi:MAG: MBL fold metallo-hydrolase [Sedimentisphaerales bacterium]|nr:MBL fold metallo-hydrolase [Sedimentisphaerales bacterium]
MKTRLISILMAGIVMAGYFSRYCLAESEKLSEHVTLYQGPVNGILIEQNDKYLAMYGAPSHQSSPDMVLFTHSRRDVAWAGIELVKQGAKAFVPDAERQHFTEGDKFWQNFTQRRYNDFEQQTTRILTQSIHVSEGVKGGDAISWQGLKIDVLDTPGYSRGAVSYLISVDQIKYAFVGDMIYGQGQLLDLYSLQDVVPEARIGGYHGWAGRMGQLIDSLRRIKTQNPDILIPARGPVIRQPSAAIDTLIARLQAVYRNYLSVSAGRWYFKDNYDILARLVLGDTLDVPWMDWAVQIEKAPPDWVVSIHNARLILSQTGRGFLIDCGGKNIIDELVTLRDQGRLKGLDGVFITHYHADHTDAVPALLTEFPAPVYAVKPLDDILRHPGSYRLPVISPNATPNLQSLEDGHSMPWREFTLTFYDFPGQTIYHSALLVERQAGGRMLFVGDSFTPSGMDDYCLQNRNLLHDGTGYPYCFEILRKMPADCLLNNQHVFEPFRFSAEQLDHMDKVLQERKKLMAELFPWDDPNYGIDERWIRLFPYGQCLRPGQHGMIEVCIFNHSAHAHSYKVQLHSPLGIYIKPDVITLDVPPRAEKRFSVPVLVCSDAADVNVITADVEFDDRQLRHWTEAMIETESGEK